MASNRFHCEIISFFHCISVPVTLLPVHIIHSPPKKHGLVVHPSFELRDQTPLLFLNAAVA